MKFHNLKRANNSEVIEWIDKNLKFTDYQKSVIGDREIMRSSPFYFYKINQDENVSILWRLSVVPFFFYIIVLYILFPFKWIITGKGYGRNFVDNFHSKWVQKINL